MRARKPPFLPWCAENEQEDFLLSSYDATCSLAPASARALLSGDATQPMRFTARFLCMGQMQAVVESEVPQERLRLAPLGSNPFGVFGGGITSSAGLCVGEEVEVQWKGRRAHPFGWWFGTVQRARGNRITLVFRCGCCSAGTELQSALVPLLQQERLCLM
jgi:hypothetical protein